METNHRQTRFRIRPNKFTAGIRTHGPHLGCHCFCSAGCSVQCNPIPRQKRTKKSAREIFFLKKWRNLFSFKMTDWRIEIFIQFNVYVCSLAMMTSSSSLARKPASICLYVLSAHNRKSFKRKLFWLREKAEMGERKRNRERCGLTKYKINY